jgi:hypothetical protein
MYPGMIRLAQEYLNEEGYRAGPVTGVIDPKTEKAIEKGLHKAGSKVPEGWEEWSKQRKLIAGVQLVAKANDVDSGKIDGYWGPITEYAYTSLRHQLEHGELPRPWRDIPPNTANPNNWPMQRPQRALTDFYGAPGTNQIRLELPYTHRLSWDLRKTVDKMTCHKKVAPSIERVLTKVLRYYGEEGIRELRLDRWGGTYNKRKKRGGTTWSMHAWGIALDYDPDRNKLHWGRDQAVFALPDYDKWWEFWEAEGWVSLGRAKNFDWMHIQAARVT